MNSVATPLHPPQHHFDPQLLSHGSNVSPSQFDSNASLPPFPELQPQPSEDEPSTNPATLPSVTLADAQAFDMQPPPETTFDSFADLHAFAQSHAAAHGYALSINTTAKNRARVKLACVCYGSPKNTHKLTEETRVRKNRASAKTGCRMWVEGKKMDDGTWVLRVGEGKHNHPGRNVEEWSVHRRRTWGLGGTGGGIVAGAVPAAQTQVGGTGCVGEIVWRIVETEMSRGAAGSGINESTGARDRGVGRTVKVLQERLPGIRIFKRDIYNIRAQIKKARKEQENRTSDSSLSSADFGPNSQAFTDLESQLDPALVEQCNQALRNQQAAQNQASQESNAATGRDRPFIPASEAQLRANQQAEEDEVLQLRVENQDLREQLDRVKQENQRRVSENEELKFENQRLKVEIEQRKLEVLFQRRPTSGMGGAT